MRSLHLLWQKAKELESELSKITEIKGYQSDASDYDAAQKLVRMFWQSSELSIFW